ncbi:TIGR03862 family flavoprotein [Sulfitobacter sp. HI0023]|uniref:TIGR03862 family flavoprotein n=6 Tax=unclassified Sulfitobacter TaxID=196795 RepID=UPI0007C38CE4|nr:TIGR03862 family flavoprotein [Sulfitobacter sp. HI0023]KZX99692.1 NAD(FAD)-utilizing dehydrogenase [Sulfitobacter sp. HI0023]
MIDQKDPETRRAVVIGGGPAGLAAAEVMAQKGMKVTICEAKPSVARKFLMAGKSGLNLTMAEERDAFDRALGPSAPHLAPMLDAFDQEAVQHWAEGLGQRLFTGSTGRVFPEAMKASPLLRAWLRRLDALAVERRVGWRWIGWEGPNPAFRAGGTRHILPAAVTVLALGGASWSRLGSDGRWMPWLAQRDVPLVPFEPANAGVRICWSDHMRDHFGQPLKGVRWHAGDHSSRGEASLSSRGLEGGGIYTVSRALREGADLSVDLLPDRSVQSVAEALDRAGRKASLSNRLRKALRPSPAVVALVQEMARPLPQEPQVLAALLKRLPIAHDGLRPLDEAISTAGGVSFDAVDQGLMLRAVPGVFVAGEILDWEAPTGGYLLTACLATGRWAGAHAAEWAAAR